jgi:signal transduction histidine kinase
LSVLLVEDNSLDAELTIRELKQAGFDAQVERTDTAATFLEKIRSRPPQVVLADYNLGGWKGIEAVEILRNEGLDIPVILVTGALGETTAVECMKQGATDYVLKESLGKLPLAIRRAMHEQQLRQQRRQAEEDLARSARDLARSNQDLEQFAYVASHDLQEPLRMVATYTQLLAERYKGKLDEPADKYIRYAVDGALRMQALIQDLLAFSRAGRANCEMSETDCTPLVQQSLLNLESAVRESGAEVTCTQLPALNANASQLRQVFQNLIGNAIKFRGAEPPKIRIAAEKNGGDWRFSVADNGIGIPSDQTTEIFEVFHRLHTREEHPGNGIGLAICKRIVECHGGRIWAESGEGNGTTFLFTLPAQPPLHGQGQGNETRDQCETRGAIGR